MINELLGVLRAEKRIGQFEIVVVNDGSVDGTADAVGGIKDPNVRLVELPRRLGKSEALATGIRLSRFPVIATMDANLQDDPKELGAFLTILENGAECATGWRRRRRDSLFRWLLSFFSNVVGRAFLNHSFHDLNASYRVFRKSSLSGVPWFDGVHRFLPYMMRVRGVRVEEVPVRQRRRGKSRSKYRFRDRSMAVIADALAVRQWAQRRRPPV